MAKKKGKNKITGFGKVKAKLQKALSAMEIGSAKGLVNSAILIRRDMEITPPLIPIDTGNLRASYFTNTFHTFRGPGLIMGFNANYAAAVHEKTDATFKRPDSGPKFFEASLKRNAKGVKLIIGNESKIL